MDVCKLQNLMENYSIINQNNFQLDDFSIKVTNRYYVI